MFTLYAWRRRAIPPQRRTNGTNAGGKSSARPRSEAASHLRTHYVKFPVRYDAKTTARHGDKLPVMYDSKPAVRREVKLPAVYIIAASLEIPQICRAGCNASEVLLSLDCDVFLLYADIDILDKYY